MCVYVYVYHLHMYITKVSYKSIPSHHLKLNTHSIKCKQNVFISDSVWRHRSYDVPRSIWQERWQDTISIIVKCQVIIERFIWSSWLLQVTLWQTCSIDHHLDFNGMWTLALSVASLMLWWWWLIELIEITQVFKLSQYKCYHIVKVFVMGD